MENNFGGNDDRWEQTYAQKIIISCIVMGTGFG